MLQKQTPLHVSLNNTAVYRFLCPIIPTSSEYLCDLAAELFCEMFQMGLFFSDFSAEVFSNLKGTSIRKNCNSPAIMKIKMMLFLTVTYQNHIWSQSLWRFTSNNSAPNHMQAPHTCFDRLHSRITSLFHWFWWLVVYFRMICAWK